MFLETERLLLRPMRPSDVAVLARLWSDSEVTRYMGGPRDKARLLDIFAEDLHSPSSSAYDLWPVEEKASGRLVGHCGLLDKEVDGKTEIELVYVFERVAWGRGYATEIACALKRYALEEMGLGRLIALIDPENVASERVAVKAGMRLERETVRPGGKVMRVYAVDVKGECRAA